MLVSFGQEEYEHGSQVFQTVIVASPADSNTTVLGKKFEEEVCTDVVHLGYVAVTSCRQYLKTLILQPKDFSSDDLLAPGSQPYGGHTCCSEFLHLFQILLIHQSAAITQNLIVGADRITAPHVGFSPFLCAGLAVCPTAALGICQGRSRCVLPQIVNSCCWLMDYEPLIILQL